MPKTEVLNQVTESLDSATEEMNGATGEPDQGAKIMDASPKELEPTAENLDIDVLKVTFWSHVSPEAGVTSAAGTA